MRKPTSVDSLANFGRVRLSRSFFMRDFLYSEIAQIHGIPNIPDDPDIAIAAGTRLCEELLEPLQDAFGRIAVRGSYRAGDVNALGNRLMRQGRKGIIARSTPAASPGTSGMSPTIAA